MAVQQNRKTPSRRGMRRSHDALGAPTLQLVVFPEYLLGRITVPGPVTRKIAQAAAAAKIYVVVGCWEVRDDGTFANTALIFDRQGNLVIRRSGGGPPPRKENG